MHNTWGNYNKVDTTTSLRVYYRYVSMPQCGYIEHGLKDIKPASNNVGCICEQIWKDQWGMKVWISMNRAKWSCSRICIKLVITIENYFTFVKPLTWAAIIGYMKSKGRPFYTNDVIWLNQVTVPLYQRTVPLLELRQIQMEMIWYKIANHLKLIDITDTCTQHQSQKPKI